MMKRPTVTSFAMLFMAMAAGAGLAHAQKAFEAVTGKEFDSALPKDFYLEGNAIPTQKRNAALLISPSGRRLVVALIDTSGYSSRIQTKYIGMIINEGPVAVCGKELGIGSFGFGLKMPSEPSDADADFFVYDQAGQKVSQCAAKKDKAFPHPTPLEIVLKGEKTALLYLGRYVVEFRP